MAMTFFATPKDLAGAPQIIPPVSSIKPAKMSQELSS